jgi:hypothetical protein
MAWTETSHDMRAFGTPMTAAVAASSALGTFCGRAKRRVRS